VGRRLKIVSSYVKKSIAGVSTFGLCLHHTSTMHPFSIGGVSSDEGVVTRRRWFSHGVLYSLDIKDVGVMR
jgi:hypothetical protein